MSRGLGLLQRQVLQRLWSLAEREDPQKWHPINVLGITSESAGVPASRAERATYRRAVRTLAARGLVECRMMRIDVRALPSWKPDHRLALHARATEAGRTYVAERQKFEQRGSMNGETLWLLAMDTPREIRKKQQRRAKRAGRDAVPPRRGTTPGVS